MIRRTSRLTLGGVTLGAAALLLCSGTALAGHSHYVDNPGGCQQVGAGQTAIDDEAHGGWHRFHFNVHMGATEDDDNERLGNGNSRVRIVTECD